jgi:hypothetical protein
LSDDKYYDQNKLKELIRNYLEVEAMSNSTGTGSNGSRMEVPQAKDAMDRFKMEVAGELGVNLKSGYNGDLTSAEAGSIGGEMVRQMIRKQEEQMSGQN